jgi:flavoprotein
VGLSCAIVLAGLASLRGNAGVVVLSESVDDEVRGDERCLPNGCEQRNNCINSWRVRQRDGCNERMPEDVVRNSYALVVKVRTDVEHRLEMLAEVSVVAALGRVKLPLEEGGAEGGLVLELVLEGLP